MQIIRRIFSVSIAFCLEYGIMELPFRCDRYGTTNVVLTITALGRSGARDNTATVLWCRTARSLEP